MTESDNLYPRPLASEDDQDKVELVSDVTVLRLIEVIGEKLRTLIPNSPELSSATLAAKQDNGVKLRLLIGRTEFASSKDGEVYSLSKNLMSYDGRQPIYSHEYDKDYVFSYRDGSVWLEGFRPLPVDWANTNTDFSLTIQARQQAQQKQSREKDREGGFSQVYESEAQELLRLVERAKLPGLTAEESKVDATKRQRALSLGRWAIAWIFDITRLDGWL